MSTLEYRMSALELSFRRWRFAALGLSLVLATGAIVAANSQPEVIKARRIEVVDERGSVVVALHCEEVGGRIEVYGKHGPEKHVVLTTSIGQDDCGGSMDVISRGTHVIHLGVDPLGAGAFVVSSQGKKPLVMAGSGADGNGRVAVRAGDASNGAGVALIGGDKDGYGGCLVVTDRQGHGIITAGVDEHGNGRVTTYDREGKKGRALTPGP